MLITRTYNDNAHPVAAPNKVEDMPMVAPVQKFSCAQAGDTSLLKRIASRFFKKQAPKETDMHIEHTYAVSDGASFAKNGYTTGAMLLGKEVNPITTKALSLGSSLCLVTGYGAIKRGARSFEEGRRVDDSLNKVNGVVVATRGVFEITGGAMMTANSVTALSGSTTKAAALAARVTMPGLLAGFTGLYTLLAVQMGIHAGRGIYAMRNVKKFIAEHQNDPAAILEFLKNQIRITAEDVQAVYDANLGEKGIPLDKLKTRENKGVLDAMKQDTHYDLVKKYEDVLARGAAAFPDEENKRNHFMACVWRNPSFSPDEITGDESDHIEYAGAFSPGLSADEWKELQEAVGHRIYGPAGVENALKALQEKKATALIDAVMTMVPDDAYGGDAILIANARDLLMEKIVQKAEHKIMVAETAFPGSVLEKIKSEVETDSLSTRLQDASDTEAHKEFDGLVADMQKKFFWQTLHNVAIIAVCTIGAVATGLFYAASAKIQLVAQVLSTLVSFSMLTFIDGYFLWDSSGKIDPTKRDKLMMLVANVVILAAVVTASVLTGGALPLAVAGIGGLLALAMNLMMIYKQRQRAQAAQNNETPRVDDAAQQRESLVNAISPEATAAASA